MRKREWGMRKEPTSDTLGQPTAAAVGRHGDRPYWVFSTRNVEPDSAEPLYPEPFGRELRVERLRVKRLTAEGLVAG